MRLSLAIVGSALLLSTACAPRGPLAGAVVPEGAGGTIAGRVTTNGEATAVSARKVTATNSATGARFEASTASNGGYTIKVPAGTYRLELELRGGERLATQPETTDVNVGDVDADRNFLLAR
jgi:hypothetical protein